MTHIIIHNKYYSFIKLCNNMQLIKIGMRHADIICVIGKTLQFITQKKK